MQRPSCVGVEVGAVVAPSTVPAVDAGWPSMAGGIAP